MAKANITISIDKAIHEALEDLAQKVWDQHKVRVDSVSFDWFESPGYDGTNNIVQGASIHSQSYRNER